MKDKKIILTLLCNNISKFCPFEAYIMKTSIELLQQLSRDTNCENNKIVAKNVTNVESRIHSIITQFQLKNSWHVKRDRFKHFNNGNTSLPELRITSSYLVNHVRILLPKQEHKETTGICPLCMNARLKSKTKYECIICKVPL